MRVAVIELVPCAMLANGPPWTNAGTPSRVCTRFGLIASLSSAAIAPTARGRRRAPACRRAEAHHDAAEPRLEIAGCPGQAQDRHHLAGGRDVEAGLARHALLRPPSPITMSRSARSFMSSTRRHSDAARSRARARCRGGGGCRRSAASRLWALETAWMSPVKCRLMSVGRHHLRRAAARAAALHAEERAERRLAQRRRGAHPVLRQPLRQPDRGRGLALARRRGRDRRDQDQPAARRAAVERGQRRSWPCSAVRLEMRGIDAQRARDFDDGFHQVFPLVRARRRPRPPPAVVSVWRGVLHSAPSEWTAAPTDGRSPERRPSAREARCP